MVMGFAALLIVTVTAIESGTERRWMVLRIP